MGKINFPDFRRRILCIYPMMIVFPSAILFAYWQMGMELDYSHMTWRLVGIAGFCDNFASYSEGFNPILFSPHLWTLSFEFQIYAVIPFLFLVYKAVSLKNFMLVIVLFWVSAVFARTFAQVSEVPHPVVWVTPFLRSVG